MIPVEEAKARILAAMPALPAETVGLREALGRVLAEPVVSRLTQPPSAVSAMDGYAVRAADLAKTPATLKCVGEAPAGGAFEGSLGAGEAVRIFTGGPMPHGGDTVVIQEITERDGDSVTVLEPAKAGSFVRPEGLDFRRGEEGIPVGRRLTVRDIGLAAAMNVPWLRVHRRPRVAILSTGDELVMPGEAVGPNQIIGSNGLALSAFVEACGGEPVNLGIAPDSAVALGRLAADTRGADLLVTSGGVSVGDHDLVKTALDGQGLELDFWRIAMRPGKPLLFGRVAGIPVLGVPGNPVSAVVCALIFLGPAIDALAGRTFETHAPEMAVLGGDLGPNDQRQDYLRGTLADGVDGRRVATPFERQDSSMLATLAHADCLVVRPPHAPAAKAGEPVEVVPFAGGVVGI